MEPTMIYKMPDNENEQATEQWWLETETLKRVSILLGMDTQGSHGVSGCTPTDAREVTKYYQ